MEVVREKDPVLAPDKDAPLVRELDDALAKSFGRAKLHAPSGEEIELPHFVLYTRWPAGTRSGYCRYTPS